MNRRVFIILLVVLLAAILLIFQDPLRQGWDAMSKETNPETQPPIQRSTPPPQKPAKTPQSPVLDVERPGFSINLNGNYAQDRQTIQAPYGAFPYLAANPSRLETGVLHHLPDGPKWQMLQEIQLPAEQQYRSWPQPFGQPDSTNHQKQPSLGWSPLWQHTLESRLSAPAVADATTLFLGMEENTVQARSLIDGTTQWTVSLQERPLSLLLGREFLLVANALGTITPISLQKSKALEPVGLESKLIGWIWLAQDDLVVFAANGMVQRVTVQAGLFHRMRWKPQWQTQVADFLTNGSGPVLHQHLIWVDRGDQLIGLNPETGAMMAESPLPWSTSSPDMTRGNASMAFVSSEDVRQLWSHHQQLVVVHGSQLALLTGEPFQLQKMSQGEALPLATSGAHWLTQDPKGRLRLHHRHWQQPLTVCQEPLPSAVGPLLLTGRQLLLGDRSGSLHEIDLATGHHQRLTSDNQKGAITPLLISHGILVAATDKGTITAYKGQPKP